jgi:hypothetical protein
MLHSLFMLYSCMVPKRAHMLYQGVAHMLYQGVAHLLFQGVAHTNPEHMHSCTCKRLSLPLVACPFWAARPNSLATGLSPSSVAEPDWLGEGREDDAASLALPTLLRLLAGCCCKCVLPLLLLRRTRELLANAPLQLTLPTPLLLLGRHTGRVLRDDREEEGCAKQMSNSK